MDDKALARRELHDAIGRHGECLAAALEATFDDVSWPGAMRRLAAAHRSVNIALANVRRAYGVTVTDSGEVARRIGAL